MNLNKRSKATARPTGFVISPYKVILLGIACLMGATITYMLWHRESIRSKEQVVELPEAAYARTGEPNYTTLVFTVGPNGQISNENGIMSLEELEVLLAREIQDKPRVEGKFMDGEGGLVKQEYVKEFNVDIRVDADCPAEKLAPILSMLKQRGIRRAAFRVNEE